MQTGNLTNPPNRFPEVSPHPPSKTSSGFTSNLFSTSNPYGPSNEQSHYALETRSNPLELLQLVIQLRLQCAKPNAPTLYKTDENGVGGEKGITGKAVYAGRDAAGEAGVCQGTPIEACVSFALISKVPPLSHTDPRPSSFAARHSTGRR